MPHTFTIILVGAVVVLLVGLLAGYLLSSDDNNYFTKKNLRLAVGTIVSIVWVVSIAAEIIIPTYTVSVFIHGIMGAVVGYLFSDKGITFNIGG